MGIGRQLLSALIIPKDEFRAMRQEEKRIPDSLTPFSAMRGQHETYVDIKIGFFTRKITHYVRPDGGWTADPVAEDEELSAVSEFYKPQAQIDREAAGR